MPHVIRKAIEEHNSSPAKNYVLFVNEDLDNNRIELKIETAIFIIYGEFINCEIRSIRDKRNFCIKYFVCF